MSRYLTAFLQGDQSEDGRAALSTTDAEGVVDIVHAGVECNRATVNSWRG